MDDTLEHMRAAYKSFDNPEFHFVGAALDDNPYAALVGELQRSLDVEEDTDPNDDVSFGYLLSQGDRTWVLRLSMVGRYAVLLRLTASGGVEVVQPGAADLAPVEERVLALLSGAGVRLLDQPTLEQRVALHLDDLDADDVRLYQALFSATDVLPWQA